MTQLKGSIHAQERPKWSVWPAHAAALRRAVRRCLRALLDAIENDAAQVTSAAAPEPELSEAPPEVDTPKDRTGSTGAAESGPGLGPTPLALGWSVRLIVLECEIRARFPRSRTGAKLEDIRRLLLLEHGGGGVPTEVLEEIDLTPEQEANRRAGLLGDTVQ